MRPPLEIETEDFIGVKSFKAKGKRISTYTIDTITELEPTRFPEPDPEPESDPESASDPESDPDLASDTDPSLAPGSDPDTDSTQPSLFDF